MKQTGPRPTRVFRHHAQDGMVGFVFLAAGTFTSAMGLLAGKPDVAIVSIPFLFLGAGLAYSYRKRRIEVDDQGIRVFNALGTQTGRIGWHEVTGYRTSTWSMYRPKWMLQTPSAELVLPSVDHTLDLQLAILSYLPAGVLQQNPRETRPTSKGQAEEIHLLDYRSIDERVGFVFYWLLIVLIGTAMAILSYLVLDGRNAMPPLLGFGLGLLIMIGVVAISKIHPMAKRARAGRQIDLTSSEIVLWEQGTKKSIAWSNLLLVEKQIANGYPSIFLFDGRTFILYRECWKHCDALLRYTSKEAPPSTVFSGFG